MNRRSKWLIGLQVPLLVLTACAGLFFPAIYEGHVAATYIPECRGQDAISLFAAAPLLIASLLTRRKYGPIVATGALAYSAYVFLLYAYGGVVNPLYFAYIAGLGLSIFAAFVVTRGASFDDLSVHHIPHRSVAVFFWLISLVLTMVWVVVSLDAIESNSTPDGNTMIVTDLAFVLPGLTIAGIGLWRRRRWAVYYTGAGLVMLSLLMTSIVAGQTVKQMSGMTPTWGLFALFGTIGLISIVLAFLVLRRVD